MTQDNRIQKFIGELLDNELSQSQCAIIFGEDEKPEKKKGKEKKQSEEKPTNRGCSNDRYTQCQRFNRSCKNYGEACMPCEIENHICWNYGM